MQDHPLTHQALTATAEKIAIRYRAAGESIVTVESCTGGMLAAVLTEVAGASAWFAGGFVTYSNHGKEKLVKVPAALLKRYGAVSAEVASAMAIGGLQAIEADWAIAITGIAGPGGGTPLKPVGTVYLALATTGSQQSAVHIFTGNRHAIRMAATQAALNALLHRECKNKIQ